MALELKYCYKLINDVEFFYYDLDEMEII